MKITILYASLLAILFMILSVRTIKLRRSLKIGLGTAGNAQMTRAMRVHSNFSEYVPFSILLIYFVEAATTYPLFVHGLGFLLLVGRISHAYGVSQEKENFVFRVMGMALTFTVILTCSGYLLYSLL